MMPETTIYTFQRSFLVGPSRFELLTCRLGGGRSIQLSYGPDHTSLYRRNPLFPMSFLKCIPAK
jgi:hypothetical protein